MNHGQEFFRVLDVIENDLLTCLCDKLNEEGRPVCACHVYAGDQLPVADRCGMDEHGQNGQAWLRRGISELVGSSEESNGFSGFGCVSGAWTTTIQIGIYRCIEAIFEEEGNAPPVEAYVADRELLMADRQSLASVLCCPPLDGEDDPQERFDWDISVVGASIETTGPTGGCAGSVLTIRLSSMLLQEDVDPDVSVFISGPAGGG